MWEQISQSMIRFFVSQPVFSVSATMASSSRMLAFFTMFSSPLSSPATASRASTALLENLRRPSVLSANELFEMRESLSGGSSVSSHWTALWLERENQVPCVHGYDAVGIARTQTAQVLC